MSLRSHRVNKLEYGEVSSLFFGSSLRNYLSLEGVINSFENDFQEEIDVEKLKEFLKDYENEEFVFDDEEIEKEIEEYDLIDYLYDELKFAEKNNLDYILYHIF